MCINLQVNIHQHDSTYKAMGAARCPGWMFGLPFARVSPMLISKSFFRDQWQANCGIT
jgi:hypothetical protein